MRQAFRRLKWVVLASILALALPSRAFGAAAALIDFAQGATDPIAGIAMIGVTGTSVSVANGVNTGVLSWQVNLVYAPPGSSLSTGTVASNNSSSVPAASFTPDVAGSYRVQLQVWDAIGRSGAATDTDIRVICVPEAGTSVCVPPYQGGPARVVTKPDELNFGGQAFGYAGTGTTTDGLAIYQAKTFAANMPSSTQKSALAGSSGTPGSGNKYVTDADARNTNARTPTAHASTHQSGGSDSIALDTLAVETDVTTLNATTSHHGLLLKLSGTSTDCLNGGGSWATCSVASTNITDSTSVGRLLLTAVSAAAARTASGSVIGTDVEAYDADLAAIAAVTSASDQCLYATGTGTWALTACPSAGRSMMGATTAKAEAALWGATLPTTGTNIPDADTTITVAGGSSYTMPTVTANRVVTFGVTGSPVSGAEVMRVQVTRTSAFTVTFKDDAATTLVVCPVSVPCAVVVKHDGTHFANPSLVRIQ